MKIELDPEGQPHWLIYWQRIKRRLRRARRRFNDWQRLQRDLRESAAFMRRHGGVKSVEENTEENRRKP